MTATGNSARTPSAKRVDRVLGGLGIGPDRHMVAAAARPCKRWRLRGRVVRPLVVLRHPALVGQHHVDPVPVEIGLASTSNIGAGVEPPGGTAKLAVSWRMRKE